VMSPPRILIPWPAMDAPLSTERATKNRPRYFQGRRSQVVTEKLGLPTALSDAIELGSVFLLSSYATRQGV